MARQERYFVGPQLLGDIRNTIAKVDVLAPGGGRPAQVALQELRGRPSGTSFRIATFTGAWAIDTSKTVTFKYQTATPNTAVVTNLFANITATGTRNCAIAKDGTAWFLIAAQC